MHTFVYTGPSASPSKVEIPSWSAKSITISWATPKGEELNGKLTGFFVRVNTTVNANGSRTRARREIIQVSRLYNVSENSTSFTLEDLKPATRYSLEVAATTSVGAGPFSKPVYQTTGEDGKLQCFLLIDSTTNWEPLI